MASWSRPSTSGSASTSTSIEDCETDTSSTTTAPAMPADRVLAVTPEYNGTMPAVLNNAIDWLSRPYGQGALVGKPFGVIGTTPTPYGGKWSHADAARSAGIAGAVVVEDVAVSQSSIDVDVLSDPDILGRLHDAIARLVDFRQDTAAA